MHYQAILLRISDTLLEPEVFMHVLHSDIQVIIWKFQRKHCMALSKMIFKCSISNINHESNESTRINFLRSKIHLNDV